MKVSDDKIRLLRLRAQRLYFPGEDHLQDAAAVIEAVCGVQAQDEPAGELSAAVRSSDLTLASVDQAFQEGRLIRTWCMRGTLHLIRREDAAWLIPFLGPPFAAANQRRFAQLGWNEDLKEKALRLIRKELEDQGSRTREEIVDLLQSNGLPYEGQATIHLLNQAALLAILVQGPDRGKQPTYVLFEEWAGQPQPRPRPEALAELAHRFLAAYAPANPSDFAAWSGLSAKDAREAWASIQAGLVSLETARGLFWILKTQTAWLDGPPPDVSIVRLLPRFDTYLLGYADRSLTVDARYAQRINAGGGIIHPTLIANGRALGTWKTNRRTHNLDLIIEPFEPLPSTIPPALDSEVAHLARIFNTPINLHISTSATD